METPADPVCNPISVENGELKAELAAWEWWWAGWSSCRAEQIEEKTAARHALAVRHDEASERLRDADADRPGEGKMLAAAAVAAAVNLDVNRQVSLGETWFPRLRLRDLLETSARLSRGSLVPHMLAKRETPQSRLLRGVTSLIACPSASKMEAFLGLRREMDE
jgi:hypothetical protein